MSSSNGSSNFIMTRNRFKSQSMKRRYSRALQEEPEIPEEKTPRERRKPQLPQLGLRSPRQQQQQGDEQQQEDQEEQDLDPFGFSIINGVNGETKLVTNQHLFSTRKRTAVEINKALTTMGFGTWNGLEPEAERENRDYVKDRLNQKLFQKVQQIEEKREKEYLESKRTTKISKAEQRKMKLKQQQDEMNGDFKPRGTQKKSLIDEERAIHEAYQILLSEYNMKRTQRDRVARDNAERRAAEEARNNPEQQKMVDELDRLNIDSAESLEMHFIGGNDRNDDDDDVTGNDNENDDVTVTHKIKRSRSSRRRRNKNKNI